MSLPCWGLLVLGNEDAMLLLRLRTHTQRYAATSRTRRENLFARAPPEVEIYSDPGESPPSRSHFKSCCVLLNLPSTAFTSPTFRNSPLASVEHVPITWHPANFASWTCQDRHFKSYSVKQHLSYANQTTHHHPASARRCTIKRLINY